MSKLIKTKLSFLVSGDVFSFAGKKVKGVRVFYIYSGTISRVFGYTSIDGYRHFSTKTDKVVYLVGDRKLKYRIWKRQVDRMGDNYNYIRKSARDFLRNKKGT